MSISVVVPTLGTRLSWLDTCLRSVRRQGESDLHVIVVAPSTAPVADLVERYNCIWLEDPAQGLSAALNRGLEKGSQRSEFVTWIGDDDVLAPGSLTRTRSALRDRRHAPFAYGRVRFIDDAGDTICVQWPTRFAWRTLAYGQDHVAQPGSLLRVAALQAVGAQLDVGLRNAMDLELFLRLRRLARPVYVNAEVAAYRLHQASITMSKGASDESEVVRARFQPAAARSTRVLWRPIMAGFDRAFAASAWHLNKPAVALVDGRPYTEGQQ